MNIGEPSFDALKTSLRTVLPAYMIPSRFATIRTILADYTVTTPAAMQALAAQYLRKDRSWRVAIVPQGQGIAAGPGKAPAGR